MAPRITSTASNKAGAASNTDNATRNADEAASSNPTAAHTDASAAADNTRAAHEHATAAPSAPAKPKPAANRPLPALAELLPGVWRLPLPLRDSPLGHVNTYLVRADDGYLLVDCGWDTADTLGTLEGHLRALDIRFGDVRHLVITHIHPDHYGLAGRLREITNADLSFHRLERLYIESRYADADDLLAEMREWLRLNGTPQSELDQLNRGSTSMMSRVQIAFPDQTLDGGEEIPCGRFSFKVVWTPGHSAGHICLYDRAHKILLSGDHVLPRITPSVGLHVRSTGNPLADYLDSLKLIGKLEAELVMPGHGEPFHGLPERTGELLAHHQRRLDEIRSLLGRVAGTKLTGYEIAAQMRWGSRKVWDDLSGFERRLAVTETLAHTELLHARGQVEKQCADGVVSYFVATDAD
jgi:glyoxylase-like metal-dependent hydrolase (beta-lactamase superfamily II)